MAKVCTIIGFIATMASLVPSQDLPNGCGVERLNKSQVLIIAPNASCNLTLEEGYLIMDELELQPNDKITLKVLGEELTLNTNVLPLVKVPQDSILKLNLDPKNSAYRRLTAYLSSDCSHTLQLTDPPPRTLRLPTPQILVNKSTLSCTLSLSPPKELKLSISVLQLKLMAGSSLTIHHHDGTNDTIPNGDKCDYIEEQGAQLMMVVKDPADLVVLQAEPVIASCSGEATLLESSSVSIDLTKHTAHYPDLECRYAIHYHGVKNLVGHLSPNYSDSDSYLHIHNGGSANSPTLLLKGPKEIKEGYFVTGAESLLLRYSNITGELRINSSENSGYLSTPKNFSMGVNSVYLLELQGKAVVLSGPEELKGPLQLYSDYSDSAHLMKVPAGPLNHVLVSSTSRLMVKSSNATNLTLSSSIPGCYKMSLGPSDTYVLDHQLCSEDCQWVVPPSTDVQGELALHIATAQMKDKDQAKLYVLGEKEPLMELKNEVRELYLPAKSGYRLEVSRNCSSGSVLRASYDIQPACSSAATVVPGQNLPLTSPNYPDHYPLNANCTISLNTTGKALLVTVSSLDLASQHSLKLSWTNRSVELAQATDVLVQASSLQLTLLGRGSKLPLDPAGHTASGYNLTVTAADCGSALIGPNGTLTSGNASSCLWTIDLPNDTLANYSLSLPKGGQLELHDGPSLLSPAAPQTNSSLSRTSRMVVVYKKLKATEPLTLEYTAYRCNIHCNNTLCMHPSWVCNGHNDCGDWSDELHCNGTGPTPQPMPKPSPPAGWSSGSFAAAIILSFIVGLSLAYAVPIMYQRYRMTTYEPFASNLE